MNVLGGVLNVLPWPVDGLWKPRDDPLPGLNVLLFTVRGIDPLPRVLPAVPVKPRDLDVSTLRFMIEPAAFLVAGELNAAVRVTGLSPLVLIVGSTLMA